MGHIKRKWNSFSLIFTVDESSTGTRRLKIKGPSYIDWVCRSLAHCIFPYCLFHCLCNSVSSFKLIDTAKNKKVTHLSKWPSDLKINGTQGNVTFSDPAFHGLQCGVFLFCCDCWLKNNKIEAPDWLFQPFRGWFLELTLAIKRKTPHEKP